MDEMSQYVFAVKKLEDKNELTCKKGETLSDKLYFTINKNGWSLIQ